MTNRVQYEVRQALNELDVWTESAGAVARFSEPYDALVDIITRAVEAGARAEAEVAEVEVAKPKPKANKRRSRSTSRRRDAAESPVTRFERPSPGRIQQQEYVTHSIPDGSSAIRVDETAWACSTR